MSNTNAPGCFDVDPDTRSGDDGIKVYNSDGIEIEVRGKWKAHIHLTDEGHLHIRAVPGGGCGTPRIIPIPTGAVNVLELRMEGLNE